MAKNGIQYKTRMLYYGLDDLAENEEPIAQMNGKNIYDKAMGEHARNLYTSKFTTRVFEERLMAYTNELIVNWKGVYVDEAN